MAELEALWWAEAERNQVLPLDNRVLWTLAHPKPDHRAPRQSWRYFPGGSQIPEPVAVNVRNRSHRIVVDLEVPDGLVPEGTLLALGSVVGGWSLHVLDGRLRYVHNLYGKERHVVAAAEPLGPGRHRVELSFEKEGHEGPEKLSGLARLSCDGRALGERTIDRFPPASFNGVGVGLTCGYEWGPAVGEGYRAPFPFNATIVRAVVEPTGPVVRDLLAELAAILSDQ